MLSASEMIIVGVLALILIGPKQLPEVARTVGRLISELKRTANGFTSDFKNEMNHEIAKNDQPSHEKNPANDLHKFGLKQEVVEEQIPPVIEKKDEPS
jgi:sec-independent protein translocase protein TatB